MRFNRYKVLLQKYGLLAISIWTIIIVSLAVTSIRADRKVAIHNAEDEARDYYRLNLYYRAWASRMGGVYVPVDRITPNQHLQVANRDITDNHGRRLTLVNPAYMTRMVFETIHASSAEPILNKITSLDPLNPANAPDEWERKNLRAFERKEYEERSEIATIAGKPYLRFISMFGIEESCLKCHGHQGYRMGDVRGAIVISVPLGNRLTHLAENRLATAGRYSFLWILGSAAIAFSSRRRFVALQELRSSEEKFKALFEQSEDAVFLASPDGAIFGANRGACKMFGMTEEELMVTGRRGITNSGDTRWESALQERELTGGVVAEATCVRESGEVFPVEVSSVIARQEPMRTFLIVRDVTERKRAEEELRQARAMLQAAMDCSPAGIAIADAPDGRLRYVNRAALLIGGSDRAEILQSCSIDEYVSAWQLFDLDGRKLPDDEVPLARALTHGEQNGRQFIVRRGPGDERAVFANAAPIRTENGQVSAAIVVFSDVTELKKGEEELKSLAQRLRLATESAHLAVWDWNILASTMVWDDCMYELYGKSKPEVHASVEVWMDSLHPEDRERAIEQCQAALRGEMDFDIVFKICRPDGAVRHVKANGLVIRGADGSAERMIGINADITEQVLAQTEKAQLEAQLLQSQKMESIGRLAGGVAHDFNNMLQVILAQAELALLKRDPADPFHENLIEIRNAAVRSADLTRQLLAFARKQTIAPRILDLNETVTGMLKMLQRLLGEDIHLRWHPAPDLLQIRMDPSQVDQILANLCVNARDAIDNIGKITIETSNCSIDEEYCKQNPAFRPGEFVRITVSDNGRGMTKETLSHIFEPFFTTKEHGSGTGLGLATVYGIVKQNNGFINVYSEPGMGTTFAIYLPPSADTATQVQPAGTEQPARGGKETVLLVEDEPSILNITKSLLEMQGYSVFAANTPADAMRLAAEWEGTIDLMITDVVMPEMNGRDLAKQLQRLHPQLKCLYMSGYTADVIAHHGVLDEGIHFIQKPFSLPGLAEKVREVLGEGALAG